MNHDIGRPVPRREDHRLLTGRGRFTDDLPFPGETFVAFLRSPYAHARIRRMNTELARAAPGVCAVYTGAELAMRNPRTMVCEAEITGASGEPLFKPRQTILATDAVRYVGEPIAMVLAATPNQAREAADLIEIEFDEMPAVTHAAHAMESDIPVLWKENGSNVAVFWENRARAEVDRILAASPRRVRLELVNNRVIPSPMEPRAAVASYDRERDQVTLYTPSQGGRRLHTRLCQFLDVARECVRVVSLDTGGGFGIRSSTYREQLAIAWAARETGLTLRWRGDRSETFVSDYHGRDQINRADMGLDEDGRVTALCVETILNLGAFLTENGPRLPMAGGGRIIPGLYDIADFYLSVAAVFTNTVPTETYRGAGRPEANFLMERLMDTAADACGLSREEVRRRNFIPARKLPYTTPLGLIIDSGDFHGTLQQALGAADWEGFESRRSAARSRGRLRGIGFGMFIAGAGGPPTEEIRLQVAMDGRVTLFPGTYSHGQGHETVYAQLVSRFLGVPFESVDLVQGDTDTMPDPAVGTFGSRSSMMGGVAVKRVCAEALEKGRRIAAHLLQADSAAMTFADGRFKAAGGSITLAEVAAVAADPERLPDGIEPGFNARYTLHQESMNFPNGCHVCEVEVDEETGLVEIVRYTACDDGGVLLNPLIVHGQVHGGVAQGLGQALLENLVYDPETGQLLTGTYMDYGMPRAHHIAFIEIIFNPIACRTNDLGVKGVGEAGACGAPPALVSAVLDALKPLGVCHLDMPLTPQRVWAAIAAAKRGP